MSDWIFTAEEVARSPSRKDGMGYQEELITRKQACDFIEKLAKVLQLSKITQITGTTYLHRFYMRQSFLRYDKYIAATACLFLGAKIEEQSLRVTQVAQEYIQIRKSIEKDKVFAVQKHDPTQIADTIIYFEGVVMHTMVYDMTVIHPYQYINEKVDAVIQLARDLSEQEKRQMSAKIKQVAWSILNDSAYTCACLRQEPLELAAGAVYVAGMYENYVSPTMRSTNGEPWWTTLSSSFHTLQDAATFLLEAYTEPYINTRVLPAGLAKLVYTFHPSGSIRDINAMQISDIDLGPLAHQHQSVTSPMESICVTSPESSSLDRSPVDQDFDTDMKTKEFVESPREPAQVSSSID